MATDRQSCAYRLGQGAGYHCRHGICIVARRAELQTRCKLILGIVSLDIDQACQCVGTVPRSLGPSQYLNLFDIHHGSDGGRATEVYVVHQKTYRRVYGGDELAALANAPNLKEACTIGTGGIVNIGDGIRQLLEVLRGSGFYRRLRHHGDTGRRLQIASAPEICVNDNLFDGVLCGNSKPRHAAQDSKRQ